MVKLWHFKEKMGSIYKMDDKGNVAYEVTEPYVLFDRDTFVMHNIGNKEQVEAYYQDALVKCRKHNVDLCERWILMDLPKNAEELDKILQNSGYMETFLKKYGIELPI